MAVAPNWLRGLSQRSLAELCRRHCGEPSGLAGRECDDVRHARRAGTRGPWLGPARVGLGVAGDDDASVPLHGYRVRGVGEAEDAAGSRPWKSMRTSRRSRMSRRAARRRSG